MSGSISMTPYGMPGMGASGTGLPPTMDPTTAMMLMRLFGGAGAPRQPEPGGGQGVMPVGAAGQRPVAPFQNAMMPQRQPGAMPPPTMPMTGMPQQPGMVGTGATPMPQPGGLFQGFQQSPGFQNLLMQLMQAGKQPGGSATPVPGQLSPQLLAQILNNPVGGGAG